MAAAASLLWSGPLNHYRLVFTLPCSGLRSRVLLDDSPFYSCYRTLRAGTLLLWDERLTLARLGHSGKTEREGGREREREREMCQREWDGEKRERTKGKAERESGMESFMWAVCVEAAVTERLALWKLSRAHQSQEPHLRCTYVRMRVCLCGHICVRETLTGPYLHFFFARFTSAAWGLLYFKFPPIGPNSLFPQSFHWSRAW